MATRATDSQFPHERPPLATAWVVMLAAATAVLVVGAVATGVVFANVRVWPRPTPAFWVRLVGACALTIFSVSLRGLRWIFLLRRSDTRIPIRDAYIGYFAGLSLLFTPLLLGEIAVRAAVNRARGGVPFLTTAVVNVWERLLDLVALGLVAGIVAVASGERTLWVAVPFVVALVSLVPLARRMALRTTVAIAFPLVGIFEKARPRAFDRLGTTATWVPALATSVVAWVLPGFGLWLLAGEWGAHFSLLDAERTFTRAAVAGSAYLAPGGVLVAGPDMLARLVVHGIPVTSAALTVLGVRLATVGVSIVLGLVFVLLHFRSARAVSATHFDDIADAYDVQIPESRRHALLETKTDLMRVAIETCGGGRRGLDVGCGQGAYVARMRTIGFDVSGIDASAGQIQMAGRNLDDPGLVSVGSVLEIPVPADAFDFVYTINVLHHLDSVEQQRRAFVELLRVLKPGGLLFVHEINTRNVLFRFYMGYVFPSLNCIDEGVERWLLPDRLSLYTDAHVKDVYYFTFMPDFFPKAVVRVLRSIERWLEGSALRVYSAHYMAVLEKTVRGR